MRPSVVALLLALSACTRPGHGDRDSSAAEATTAEDMGGGALVPTPLGEAPGDAVLTGPRMLLPFRPLLSDAGDPVFRSGPAEALRVVVHDRDAWRAIWERATANAYGGPPPPEVDFDRDMLVVVGFGTASTGGYSVAVDSVYRVGDGIKVVVVEGRASPACLVTQAFNSPADAVLLPRSEAPVRFRERTVVHEC